MEPRVLQHDTQGEGEPLVLVPGGLTGWLSWIPHQNHLADHHRVVRVQPIHNELGAAGKAGDPGYSTEVERESLRATIDYLEIDKADFAGWSSGGRALLHFVTAYPERVRSLVLVEPPAYWLLGEDDMDDDLGRTEVDKFLVGLAGRQVSEEQLAEFLVIAGLAPDTETARNHPSWDSWAGVRNSLSWQAYIGTEPPAGDLPSISCPVLLVRGTESVAWERKAVELLGSQLPYARVVDLPGDHAAHIQSMERFLEEVERHLH